MTELIKDIIFIVMGATVVISGILTKAGWEIIGLGVCIFSFAAGLLVSEIIKNKDKLK